MTVQRKRVFFENLDGIRTAAFLMVFASHCWGNLYYRTGIARLDTVLGRVLLLGPLGVNLFFVLSGFLITYLLLTERETFGRIHVRDFYMRRILRIWPVYYVSVVFGLFVLPRLFESLQPEAARIGPANIARYLLFLVNFDHIGYGVNFRWASVLWSVSVEEQFYLCWPVLLKIVPRRRHDLLFASIVVASFFFRAAFFERYRVTHYHTLAVMSDLALGAWAASLSFSRPGFRDAVRRLPRAVIGAVYAVGLAVAVLRYDLFRGRWGVPFIGLFCALFFVFVVVEQNYADHSLFKFKNLRWMSRTGVYTYALYCFHFYAIYTVNFVRGRLGLDPDRTWVFLVGVAASLAASLAIARASYRWLEQPFLRLKKRFSFVVK